MVFSFVRYPRIVALAFLSLASSLSGQEEIPHLNAGALAPVAGSRLCFAVGQDYAASSGYQAPLRYAETGRYAGWFNNEIVFGVLPATPGYGGPYPGSALAGTVVFLEIGRVDGPTNGVFTFWQARSNAPTVTVPVGEIAGTNGWKLTDGSGRPGTDPYGHKHGRRLAVNQPGLYTLTFMLRDIGTNGPGGGPIHEPSDPFVMRFLAQPEPFTPPPALTRLELVDGEMRVRLLSEPHALHRLEGSWEFETWRALLTFTNSNSIEDLLLPTNGVRFYRAVRP